MDHQKNHELRKVQNQIYALIDFGYLPEAAGFDLCLTIQKHKDVDD